HSPDNVAEISSLKPLKVDQVAIGSCTNSSYTDLMKVAFILKGKKVHPDVSLVISPGSSNILKMMADNGALGSLIASGARILEAGCGPCIGMGQAPKTGAVSLRTFNRNFKGRCGTISAGVYLVSPEAAAYSAIKGVLSDPTELGEAIDIALPDKFFTEDNYFIYADKNQPDIKVEMGPNIKPFPLSDKLEETYSGKVLLKTGDNITTDDIMPSNAALLPFRSNIPELSKHCFGTKCNDFKDRSDRFGGGIIIGGENYGQGSSREHAALVPLYLKVKVVLAKSFARIHKANLINAGIVPLEFTSSDDYDSIDLYDELYFGNIASALKGSGEMIIENKTKGSTILAKMTGSDRDRETLMAGGTINLMKAKG
ncbi:MAG: aconitate hydratase, partial [Peptostreptococcaceae bacterium]|nr:aconitate hydratase [Peptostreptococcaceae bacterium]